MSHDLIQEISQLDPSLFFITNSGLIWEMKNNPQAIYITRKLHVSPCDALHFNIKLQDHIDEFHAYVGLDENYIYHVLFITDVDHPLSYIYPTLTYYGLDQYLIYDNK